jgi:hypothetical protein
MQSLRVYRVYTLLILIGVCALYSLVGFFVGTKAEATHDTPKTFHDVIDLAGFAWSDGIGWVSFNCNQPGASPAIDTCATVNYSVSVIPDTNSTDSVLATLSGYAWSENIGWIKFGGLSNFPGGSADNAQIVFTDGEYRLSGWVRACAGTLSGDCSNMDDHPDGWDGWISLNCSNLANGCDAFEYRVLVDTDAFDGEGWGDDVIGYIDFSYVTFAAPCTPSNMCTLDDTGTIHTDQFCTEEAPVTCQVGYTCIDAIAACAWGDAVGVLTIDPTLARKGKRTTMDWTVAVISGGVSSCYVEGTNGDYFTGVNNGMQGNNVQTSPLQDEFITYTLFCIPQSGGSPVELDAVTVRTLPLILES